METAEELTLEDFAKVKTGQEGCTIPPTVSLGAAATVITIFTIPLALGGLAVGGLLTTRGYEDTAVGKHVLEGLAALQLEDLGAVTRAVTRATARVLTEERSTPKLTLPTAIKAGKGERKGMAQPPRTPHTRASPDPPAQTMQPVPETRRDARVQVQGVGPGGRRVPDGRQRGPVVHTR